MLSRTQVINLVAKAYDHKTLKVVVDGKNVLVRVRESDLVTKLKELIDYAIEQRTPPFHVDLITTIDIRQHGAFKHYSSHAVTKALRASSAREVRIVRRKRRKTIAWSLRAHADYELLSETEILQQIYRSGYAS